jgi:DNA-binding XRE family transcriptional regulator
LLREQLVEKQRTMLREKDGKPFRDGDMAALLGVPRSSYVSIKNARYRISLSMMRRIVRVFPDLTQFALAEDSPTLDPE